MTQKFEYVDPDERKIENLCQRFKRGQISEDTFATGIKRVVGRFDYLSRDGYYRMIEARVRGHFCAFWTECQGPFCAFGMTAAIARGK